MKNNCVQTIVKYIFILTIVFINLITPLNAQYYEPEINANSDILIDAQTGVILSGQDVEKQFGIASLTKLMSMYVALDLIKENDIPLDTMVPISERVSKLKAESPEASGVWYNAGQEVELSKLIDLSLVYSDNSAIMAIAEFLSGSEKAHVNKMNQKAEKLNMKESVFYNVSGLTMSDLGSVQVPDTKPSDYNKSSSRDMATMIYHLLQDYPDVLKITAKETVEYKGDTLESWNLMLPGQLLEYKGVTGLKTGTSDEAGSCFAGYYTDPNGRKLISVVLGAKSGVERFYQTAALYDWEKDLDYNTFIKKDDSKNFKLAKSSKWKYQLHPMNNVDLIDNNSPQLSLEKIDYNNEYFDEKGMVKDIPAGKKVLTAYYKVIDETDAKQMRSIQADDGYLLVEYTSDTDISKQNFVTLFLTAIPRFVESLFSGII